MPIQVCCLYGEIDGTGAPSHALVSQEVLEHGGACERFSSLASCKCSDGYLMIRLRSRRKACRSMRAQGNRVARK
ncbi:hypothetical protein M405DRAFT_828256 [Rhizopogon salebrosus TDB-379]|nr:hypothetical protein M405DRAFT_828256 [Rhizopogon salebrosus TDB-379]